MAEARYGAKSGLTGEEIQQFLNLERTGQLTPEQAAGIADLRAAGDFPPAPSVAPAPAAPATAPGAPLAAAGLPPAPAQPSWLPAVPNVADVAIGFARDPLGAVRNIPSPAEVVPEPVRQSALPIAGQLIGGGLGGMPGAMAGGFAGEAINQAVGITPRSNVQLGLAAAGEPAARALGALARPLVRGFTRSLPKAVETGQEVAREMGQEIPAIVRGAGPSADDLYAQVRQYNPPINLAQTRDALKGVITEQMQSVRSARDPRLLRMAQDLTELIEANPQGVPFQQVDANLKRINARIAAPQAGGGGEWGAYKSLRRALGQDLDTAASGTGLQADAANALKAAQTQFKREVAANELSDSVTRAMSPVQQKDGTIIQTIRPTQIARDIQRGTIDLPGVSAAEKQQVVGALDKMSALTIKPEAGPGAATGSGRVIRGALAASGVGAAAGAAFGPVPAALGAAAGPLVGSGLQAMANKIIGAGLANPSTATQTTRFLVDQMTKQGAITPRSLAALAQIIRTATAPEGEPPPGPPAGTVRLGTRVSSRATTAAGSVGSRRSVPLSQPWYAAARRAASWSRPHATP
jgi:hypothetical protein